MTLAIFSGVEDPEWSITNNNPRYAEVRRLFRRATTYGPEHMPGKLGYEGFLVQEVTNGNVQPLVLVFGTESVQLQLLLLQTIPTNMIPTSLKNIIREAIQNGNVSAQLDHRTTKRNAPRYRPELWNDRLYILKNNCYNYALNVQNNCFQQPGDNSGRGASFTTTNFCSEVMQGTMSDGLVAERALGINRMREYNVPGRHLVALFCFELGKLDCVMAEFSLQSVHVVRYLMTVTINNFPTSAR